MAGYLFKQTDPYEILNDRQVTWAGLDLSYLNHAKPEKKKQEARTNVNKRGHCLFHVPERWNISTELRRTSRVPMREPYMW